MSGSGYVQIFHDLLRHPSVISAPPAYRCVLMTIIDYACFSPCIQDDHGVIIHLLPGQFLCPIRKLAELANVGRKDVEHAVARFTQIEILGQEVRHRKTIYTILWGVKYQSSGTIVGTTLGQDRDIKEEHKNTKQQQPDDVELKKLSKRDQFVADISRLFPDFDPPFLKSLIRKNSVRAIATALDEFSKAKIVTNPKGLLTSITQKHFMEEPNASKATSK